MKLRRVEDRAGPIGWMHYCPGCRNDHLIWVERPNESTGAKWTFDGNLEAPTFNPSILCFHWTKYDVKDGKAVPAEGAQKITDCHYHLHGGILKYCGDSKHALAGQNVPLPDLE